MMGNAKKKRASSSSSAPPAPVHEIDEIFSRHKRSSAPDPDVVAVAAPSTMNPTKKVPKKRKASPDGESIVAAAAGKPEPKIRKKTQDGLSIYKAEELGWNKKDAGGTPLCPFDCDCCFWMLLGVVNALYSDGIAQQLKAVVPISTICHGNSAL